MAEENEKVSRLGDELVVAGLAGLLGFVLGALFVWFNF